MTMIRKMAIPMTRFVHIHLDLGHLSPEVAALVPDFDSDDMDTSHRCPGASFSTLWAVKSGRRLATAVSAKVTLPRALSLSDFAIGTSVFAAGCVGLELVRIALARAGLPKSALDNVSIDHVSLKSASLTYMLPCAERRSTVQLKRLMHQQGLLLGLVVMYHSANNRAVYRILKGGTYADKDGEICELEDTEVSVDLRLIKGFVQVDAVLDERYLKRFGWESLVNWRDAYEEKRYSRIFDRVVRGMFQLDGVKRKHPEPSQHVIDQLGPRNQQIVHEYMQGKDSATFDSFSFVRSDMDSSRTKSWRDAQKTILTQTGININKIWKEYQWHYPEALAAQLVYPRDHAPNTEDILNTFCSENWPALLANLRREYDAASS